MSEDTQHGWLWRQAYGIAGAWCLAVAIASAPVRRLVGIEERDLAVLYRPMCWARGHDWADKDPYGVEPVCLWCHKEREK